MYYLLGGSREQLAVYHGQEGAKPECGDPGWNVFMYPVEYLTYGLGSSANVVTKPEFGVWTKEYRVADHLGSVRATWTQNGTLSEYDYEPFGKLIPSLATGGDRTTFIDKEKDRESGLGDFGVRKLDDGTARFLSIDRLWEKYPSLSPYNYSSNNPLLLKDATGDSIYFIGAHSVWARMAYQESIEYLEKHGVDVSGIREMEASTKFNVYINVTTERDATRVTIGNELIWNPLEALSFRAGEDQSSEGSISPAVSLYHELVGHLYEKYKSPGRYARNSMHERKDGYDNEMEFVAVGKEREAAEKTGEGLRFHHKGTTYLVDGPTSRIPANPTNPNKKKK